MLRRQFRQVLSDLRAELRRASDNALAVSDSASLRQTVQRVYETLYDAYDWAHLKKVFDPLALQPGQRFYEPPAGLDFDKIERAVIYGDAWSDIERGIGLECYRQFDSLKDERSSPPMRWDIRYDGAKEQIEIWPVPESSAYKLHFEGKLRFSPLTTDDDLLLIDDKVVLLYAAVELLPEKAPDREVKLRAAQDRLAVIKSRGKADLKPFKYAGGSVGKKSGASISIVIGAPGAEGASGSTGPAGPSGSPAPGWDE